MVQKHIQESYPLCSCSHMSLKTIMLTTQGRDHCHKYIFTRELKSTEFPVAATVTSLKIVSEEIIDIQSALYGLRGQ